MELRSPRQQRISATYQTWLHKKPQQAPKPWLTLRSRRNLPPLWLPNKVPKKKKKNQRADRINCFWFVKCRNPRQRETSLIWVASSTRLWSSACSPCSSKRPSKWQMSIKTASSASTWQMISGQLILGRAQKLQHLLSKMMLTLMVLLLEQKPPLPPWFSKQQKRLLPQRKKRPPHHLFFLLIKWCSARPCQTISLQWMTHSIRSSDSFLETRKPPRTNTHLSPLSVIRRQTVTHISTTRSNRNITNSWLLPTNLINLKVPPRLLKHCLRQCRNQLKEQIVKRRMSTMEATYSSRLRRCFSRLSFSNNNSVRLRLPILVMVIKIRGTASWTYQA